MARWGRSESGRQQKCHVIWVNHDLSRHVSTSFITQVCEARAGEGVCGTLRKSLDRRELEHHVTQD